MESISRILQKAHKRKLSLFLVAAIATLLVEDELKSPALSRTLRKQSSNAVTHTGALRVHVPATLDLPSQRSLSINLGGGKCEWTPPTRVVPEDIDFYKTVIAGYPSGDKRMIFLQMEALTGWPAKDEWDFEHIGMSNHPFIKANYPHHEGIWGWDDEADQVVMMVRNIRRSMVEYHDILWDIGYAHTWEEATLLLDQLYAVRPPLEDFLVWRDERVLDEVEWYGWFIDYYMEGGLMRDIFTHEKTTKHHWNMLVMPTVYTREEMEQEYDLILDSGAAIEDEYDPNCAKVTEGCEPVAVISAENLRDYTIGPAETALIANVLKRDSRIGDYVIESETWDCIWTKLIHEGRGLKTVYDRPHPEAEYNFSADMLDAMINQLSRLISKYSVSPWNTKITANKLVTLLTEHRTLIQEELDDVLVGRRALSTKDFLGPKERERRRNPTSDDKASTTGQEGEGKKDFSRYFFDMDQKLLGIRRKEMRKSLYQKRKEAQDAAKKDALE